MDHLPELRERIARLSATPERPVWIPGLTVTSVTQITRPMVGTSRPTLALTVQGAKRTLLGTQTFDYRAGQYLIATLELPVTGQVTQAGPAEPFLGLGLPLQPELIAELLLEAPPGPDPAPAGLVTGDADEELLDAVVRLLRLIDRPGDVSVLAPGVLREIHWRLISGPLTAIVRQIGRADSRLGVVGQAARWIGEHYAQVIRIDDVARHVGVSVPTLNRHFRAVTAMSPLQYQKHLRLHRARIQLIAATDDIAAIGYAVGYDSPSQFSREYRRMFGAPPGQDAQQLRDATVR